MPGPTRQALVDTLRAVLRDELAAVVRVTEMARDEATGGESKSEGKYDTRAIEASYLAAGQGERLLATRRLAGWAEQLNPLLEPTVAQVGALVQIALDEQPQWVLVAPAGGRVIEVDGVRVRLISVSSPLGAALRGLEVGDGGEVDTPTGVQEVDVLAVR